MGREVRAQRLLVLRQTEEEILFPNPLRHRRRMQRTLAVDKVLFLFEGFAADAVPTFVDTLVDVAGFVDPLCKGRDARLVARLGRSDEIVERDVQTLPGPTEFLLHLIAIGERIEAFFRGFLEHVLRVFVVAHQKPRFEAAQSPVTRDHVGRDLLVGGAEVRPTVDVINRRRDVEAAHDLVVLYAEAASAWTSFTDRPFAAASLAQSSNSGTAFTISP